MYSFLNETNYFLIISIHEQYPGSYLQAQQQLPYLGRRLEDGHGFKKLIHFRLSKELTVKGLFLFQRCLHSRWGAVLAKVCIKCQREKSHCAKSPRGYSDAGGGGCSVQFWPFKDEMTMLAYSLLGRQIRFPAPFSPPDSAVGVHTNRMLCLSLQ